MKTFIFLISFIWVNSCLSFVLSFRESFQVKDHTNASVRYASGSCSGISKSKMISAIKTVIKDYWNTVSESSLHLEFDKAVTISSLSTSSRSGSILIGCMAMGASGPNGITYTTKSSGRSAIFINDSTFQPGGYLSGAIEGVLSHELGHALGLHHSKDKASVMTYESHDWGPEPKHLAQDDKDGIVYLYPQDKELMGLLGSCNIVEDALGAEAKNQKRHFLWLVNFLLGFLIFGLPYLFLKKLFRF